MTANLLKLYIGIVFISVSGCIAQVGIYCSVFGIVYVTTINIYCVYLLLKARNRFKNRHIVDICDLAVALYGEGARKWMQIVLVLSNSMFLIFYEIFFGTQIDQLMCRSYKLTKCGKQKYYVIGLNILLLPVIYQRSFSNIASFSMLVLFFTAFSFLIIVIKCSQIIQMETKDIDEQYEWDYTKRDFEYVYWNVSMLPSFCSAMMNLYEGNQQLLNLYAEIQNPKHFFNLILGIFTFLSFIIVLGVGILGYLTFGDRIESLIIYNLPANDNISILAKAFYIATISGSFVLLI